MAIYPASMALTRRTPESEEARLRTEQTILDAAATLLDGPTPFLDLSVSDIASAAGFSRPTFYAYFTDKRELLLRLGDRLVDEVYAHASDWLERGTDDLRPTLLAVMGVFQEHRPTLLALSEAATYDPEVADFWRSFHDAFRVHALDRIRREQPGLPSHNAEALAFVLVWMTERCLTEHLTAPRVNDDALLDSLELMWTTAITERLTQAG